MNAPENPREPRAGEPVLADGRSPLAPQALLAQLAAWGIPAETQSHDPVFTVEEARALRDRQPGQHTKNLFLRNKKGTMWLVTCDADRPVDLKWLSERLGSGRLSFGSAERLMRHLGVLPGAVTPLAVINDQPGAVTLVLDAKVLDADIVNVHPLDNRQTTALAPEGLVKFLERTGHPPQYLSFDAG